MELLTNRKYWPWFYLLAVFVILLFVYKIFFHVDTKDRGQIVRDHLNGLSEVERANALGKLQDGNTMQIPRGLGTYSLEAEPSAYLQQMKSDALPEYPRVYYFADSDKRVIFINDSVYYFFDGMGFHANKLARYRLRRTFKVPSSAFFLTNFQDFMSGLDNPVEIETTEFVTIGADNESKQYSLIQIDKNGSWAPIEITNLPFSVSAVSKEAIAGIADTSFYKYRFLTTTPQLSQKPFLTQQKIEPAVSNMVQVDSVYLLSSEDSLWVGKVRDFDESKLKHCKIVGDINVTRDLRGMTKRVGRYVLFFTKMGKVFRLDLHSFMIKEESDTLIYMARKKPPILITYPELYSVGTDLVIKRGAMALLAKETDSGPAYVNLHLSPPSADEVRTSTYSFTTSALYRLDWTLDNQYKLLTATMDGSKWQPYALQSRGDTADVNSYNYIKMESGTRFMCLASVNPHFPVYAFYNLPNGKMTATELGSLEISDDMIADLTVVPNPYIIIVLSAFLITLITLGFVMVKDVSSAVEEQTQASDFGLWNLRDRIAELNKTTTHLKVRYNVMLFLGIIFGVGGVVSFYIVLRYTIHVDGKGVFDNEENIVNLIRAVVLLTFIETFTFFFLKQYRVIFNEYKLFLSVKFRLSNFFHALEVNQSDQIAAPLKKDIIKKIMDENYRLSIDDPRMLTEDLVRSNQQLLENVLNKALDEFKNK